MPFDLSHLALAPFSLDREQIEWVRLTFEKLDDAARVGQVFNLLSRGDETGEREMFRAFRPGGITRYFNSDAVSERARLEELQADAEVPLLVSADLEGSRMSLPFGTQVPNPIALSAIDDVNVTAEVADIMAREALAVGLNWSFTPLMDINAKTRSPIVPTRGFGSDPERILRHSLAQIATFQAAGLAATAKHWPGEGHDDRDQHLVTTINPLSVDEWEATHGRLYREAIGAGVLSIMTGHIAFPAFAASMGASGTDLYRPGTLSSIINIDLLRGRLGFNGLIVSDASEMAGLSSFMEVTAAKAEILKAGCDMILFATNPERHFSSVLEAVRSGHVPSKRFFEAVTRVLGLKARLGLHRPREQREIPPRASDRMKDVLLKAPVLEKDTQSLFPLSPEKTRRVLVIAPGIVEPLWSSRLPLILPDLLAKEGFEVKLHPMGEAYETKDYDLVIYAFSEEALLTRGRIFLDWASLGKGLRGAMMRPWHDVPTLMISFGYPYYLYDAPRVPTYVNAWATMDEMQEAVVELMMGRAPWNRNSPVDVFAEVPDGRY
ncbi:MAG TPA: glycoside hydrolase family 3 N-terminal domain-containing protein [Ensifer sp.]|nr:glycoside hydrolase family 3 N-terminal domain-containing protein [Ensifer sp.]